ncbi:MAG: fumarylacetoacetate hydrolase family protein [Deltaproteobacteria bacterium]|nr:fumarylacetoacetate hydrolase family protein [Deltaproteobacteria bacterium]
MQDKPFSLVTYRFHGESRVGLVKNARVREINLALEEEAASRPSAPGEEAPVRSMMDLLNDWDRKLPRLRAAAGLLENVPAENLLDLERLELLAPVPAPGKMMNVGLNFYDHAEEMGMEVPEGFQPNFFWKGDRNCIIGHGQKIRLSSDYVDWEAELAVVIGRPARDVSPDEAMGCVAGFTCHNDVTDRRLMMPEAGRLDFLAGKARDTFGPLGPALVPADQVPDVESLRIRCLVNGEKMQDTGVDRMIWGPARCISALSKVFTLQPGDVIGLGTGAGVGWTRGMSLGPGDLSRAVERMLQGGGVFLRPGDMVTVDIPGVGCLENEVEA